jgi:hypothetical protein
MFESGRVPRYRCIRLLHLDRLNPMVSKANAPRTIHFRAAELAVPPRVSRSEAEETTERTADVFMRMVRRVWQLAPPEWTRSAAESSFVSMVNRSD